VRVGGRRPDGPDADWVHLPDPIADAIKRLAGRISSLEQGASGDAAGNVRPLRHPADPDAVTSSTRSHGPNPAGG
jgi:serine O-acetyltransferase